MEQYESFRSNQMKERFLSTFIHKLYLNVIVDPRYS